MAKADLHNNIRVLRAISPVAIGTTGSGGGKTSPAIDLQGYQGVEFITHYGVLSAATEVITVVVKECDTVSGSYTSVADADLVGTEALAGLGAAARVSGSTQNVAKRVGYIGNKRYVKLQMWAAGTATALIAAEAVLHTPRILPTANP
jgi:hypothetical protein